MRKWLTIMILALAVAAGVLGPLAEMSRPTRPQELNQLLFFPARFPVGNWNPADLNYVDVYFRSEDNTLLHGWHCPCDQPSAQVLILHGNAGNLTTRESQVRLLQQANVAVFIFDYRGYGRSSGTPSIEGVLKDATAARIKFCELIDAPFSEVQLLGESLGGALAVAVAADTPPQALILQNTFSSLNDIAAIHYPDQASMLPPDTLNSLQQIGRYHGPLFQSHGEQDRIIPHSLATQLFSAANEPKEFVSLPTAGHNSQWDEAYRAGLIAFIKRSAAPK